MSESVMEDAGIVATGIVTAHGWQPAELFDDQGKIDLVLDQIKEMALNEPVVLTTAKGRKAIASNAHKVARSKVFLDDMGKQLVAGWKEQCKVVDERRAAIRTALDELKEQIQKPLKEWEEAEAKRLAGIKALIETLESFGKVAETGDRLAMETAQSELMKAYQFSTWGEIQEVTAAFDKSQASLKAGITKAVALEAQEEAIKAERERHAAELDAAKRAQEEANQRHAAELEAMKREMAELRARLTPPAPVPVVVAEPEPEPTPAPEVENPILTPEPDHRPLVLATVVDIRPVLEADYPNFRGLLADLIYEIERQPFNAAIQQTPAYISAKTALMGLA